MANIVAANVTHTVLKTRTLGDSRKSNLVRLEFGDGALTYPAGGVPITKAKMGMPTVIESLVVVDKGTSGYHFMYDQSAEKIVMWQAPAQTHTHDIKIIGGITADEPVAVNNSTTLGKNAATNRTIAGANSTTAGGIVSATLAAAAATEPSAVAIAAQTIEVEVIGW